MSVRPTPILLAGALLACTGLAHAQEAAKSFDVEFNAVQAIENGCRLTFLATNRLGSPLERAALEFALFDTDGAINRLVTLEFKQLSEGKTKVLQFQIANLECGKLGRVLVNDVTACEGDTLVGPECLEALAPSARAELSFGV